MTDERSREEDERDGRRRDGAERRRGLGEEEK